MNYFSYLLKSSIKQFVPSKIKNFLRLFIDFYLNNSLDVKLLIHLIFLKKNIIITKKKFLKDKKISKIKSKTILIIKDYNFNENNAEILVNKLKRYLLKKNKIYLFVLNERKYILPKIKILKKNFLIIIPKLIRTTEILNSKKINYFSRFFDYPGKKINVQISTENVLLLQKLLNYKIKYSISYGSLLGLIRNKSLLNWDYDVDFVILYNDLDIFLKLIPLLKKNNFQIRRLNNSLVTFDRNGDQLDVYFLKNKANRLLPEINQPNLWWSLDDFEYQIELKIGKNLFKIPKNHNRLLYRWYGNWHKIVKR